VAGPGLEPELEGSGTAIAPDHRELNVLNRTSLLRPAPGGHGPAPELPHVETGTAGSRCSGCRLARRCLPAMLDAERVRQFERCVERRRTLGVGEYLFRVGDPFRSIFALQSGCLKAHVVDAEGREHVVAFHFPGEIVGVDAIYPGRYVSSIIALHVSAVCVLPYPALTSVALGMPGLQDQLLQMLSRDMLGNSSMAGDFTAEERLAAFLVMVSARLRGREPQSPDLDLAMSRQDIANYLRLAPETVSRILARFQKSGLVKADRKHITLLDPEGLAELAACMNPYGRCA
jgi:CRP/FNR family transcriptional regulator